MLCQWRKGEQKNEGPWRMDSLARAMSVDGEKEKSIGHTWNINERKAEEWERRIDEYLMKDRGFKA